MVLLQGRRHKWRAKEWACELLAPQKIENGAGLLKNRQASQYF